MSRKKNCTTLKFISPTKAVKVDRYTIRMVEWTKKKNNLMYKYFKATQWKEIFFFLKNCIIQKKANRKIDKLNAKKKKKIVTTTANDVSGD